MENFKLTYVAEDSIVGINGEFYKVEATVDSNIRAMQWYGTQGEIEFNDGSPNQIIESISQELVDAWELGKKKSNQSNSYSVWDGTDWVEDAELKAAYEKNQQISSAKQYLSDTDFKMLLDYVPRPDGEPLADIKAKRAAARELIRQLEA